jgi:L-cysteine S-thiosulfotransferase
MKLLITTAVTAVMASAVAFAGTTAPGDVKFNDGAVADALTDAVGDAVEGRAVFAGRKLGNCLACHVNTEMPEQSFQGEVGPPLDGVADRWSETELRGIVSNSKMTFDDTIMPAFYVDTGYTRILEKFDGAPILSAQQVEDVVAYLLTLK